MSIPGDTSFIGTNKQLVWLRGHGSRPLAFPSEVLSANHGEPIRFNPNSFHMIVSIIQFMVGNIRRKSSAFIRFSVKHWVSLVPGLIPRDASFIGTNKQLVWLKGYSSRPLAFPLKVLSAHHGWPIGLVNPNRNFWINRVWFIKWALKGTCKFQIKLQFLALDHFNKLASNFSCWIQIFTMCFS